MPTILDLPNILEQFKNSHVSYMNNYNFSYNITFIRLGESRLSAVTREIVEPIWCQYYKIRKINKTTFEITVILPGKYLLSRQLAMVKEKFKVGSAITVTNFKGENWFLINGHEFPREGIMLLNVTLISEGPLKKVKNRNKTSNLVFPLNQYDRGFENADIFKFCKEFRAAPSIIKSVIDHDSYI